jgi:DNA polymerase elongation subunit (family B)
MTSNTSRATGWLLDITIEENHVVIWIKTLDGHILELIDSYQPTFYILPKNEDAGVELLQILSYQNIKVHWEKKFTDIFEDSCRRKNLICVYPDSLHTFRRLVKILGKDPMVSQLFNIDLSHVQQYLFTKCRIEPTSKVEVEYCGPKIVKITMIEDDAILQPSFSSLYYGVDTLLQEDDSQDQIPITRIRVRYDKDDFSFEGPEETVLEDFRKCILLKDPDILVCVSNNFQSSRTIQHVFSRMKKLGIDKQLGRETIDSSCLSTIMHIEPMIRGRINLSTKSFYGELELAGLIEKARFAFSPIRLRCGI